MTITNDSLLNCLETLSYILGRPASQETILSGLPITEEQLPADLFALAASHLDLNAKLKNYPLKNKTMHFPIPLVLLLKNNEACLLTDITDNGTVCIINPSNNTTLEIPYESLANIYTGQAFVIEPNTSFISQTNYLNKPNLTGKNWFWKHISRIWSAYIEVFAASVLINLFALVVPLFIMRVYNKIIPEKLFERLWIIASVILIIFLIDGLIRMLRNHFIDQAAKTVDLQVSSTIFERILGLRMTDRPRSIGVLANTIDSFVTAREFITSTAMTELIDIPFSLLFILVIGLIGGSLVYVPIISMPIIVLSTYLFQKPISKLTKEGSRLSAEKARLLFETLNGIETVKALGAEPMIQTKWNQVTNSAAQLGVKLRLISNTSNIFSIFIQQLSVVVVIIMGVYMIAANQLTFGALVACSILTSRALAPITQLTGILNRYHSTKTSLESINKIMNLPTEINAEKKYISLPQLKGVIEFKNVSFKYPNQEELIVKNISFKIHAGEHVAMVGSVGSGKSTIIKLLLGLYQPTSGTITIDNIDISQLNLIDYRRQIGYMPQDITLFSGSLHDNIVFGAPFVDDNDLLNAIEFSGVDQFVESKLGSYDANIIQGGKNLSGGQRQVVALARAILLNPQILVLDQPTYAVDHKTELFIYHKLAHFIQNKTLILVAHKPTTLNLANRIIIIQKGEIVADGPKDSLLVEQFDNKSTPLKA